MEKFKKTECGKTLASQLSGAIGDKRLEAMFNKIDQMRKDGKVVPREVLQKYINQQTENLKFELSKDQYFEIKNSLIQADVLDKLKTHKELGFKNLFDSIEATLVSNNSNGVGAGMGIANEVTRAKNTALSFFLGELERADLRDHLLDKRNGIEIGNAILSLEKGGTPVGSKKAIEIAKTYLKHKREWVAKANSEGLFLEELDDHLFTTTHNPLKLRYAAQGGYGVADIFKSESVKAADIEASMSEWKSFIDPRLDWGKIYDRLDALDQVNFDKDKFLKSTYMALISNIRKEQSVIGMVHDGSGKRIDAEMRKLMFKDAQSHVEYNDRFGTGDLASALTGTLQKLAFDEVLLRRGGDNLMANYEAAIDSAAKQFRDSGDLSVAENAIKIKSYLNHVVGNVEIGNPTIATLMSNIRSYASATMLGGSGFTSLVLDSANAASVAKMIGLDLNESIMNPFVAAFGKNSELAQHLQIGMEQFLGSVHATTYNTGNSMPAGAAQKLNNLVMSVNGNRIVTDSLKISFASALASKLASLSKVGFDGLGELQKVLKRYDISANEWEKIKGSIVDIDGRKILSADMIDDKLIASKVGTMYSDMANYAVTTPTERYAAWLNRFPQGDPMGAFLRSMLQLKSFTLAYMQRSIGLSIQKGAGVALAHAGWMTAAGAAYFTLKSISQNRDPFELWEKDKAKFAMSSFVAGGGGGYAADLIAGALQPGRTVWDSMMPPVLSKAVQAGKILTAEDKVLQATNVLKSNIPLANYPLAGSYIVDRILYEAANTLNPGLTDEIERRAEKQNRPLLIGF